MNKENCSCKCSVWGIILMTLIIIGGINWGLIGISMLLGVAVEWNIVKLLLGGIPALEAVVYLLVGVSAVLKIFCCKKNCKTCVVNETPSSNPMQ